MTSVEPFETMPLTYERASSGGFDRTDEDVTQHRLYDLNPVGNGVRDAVKTPERPGCAKYRIFLGKVISGWKDRPTPAGLGPID